MLSVGSGPAGSSLIFSSALSVVYQILLILQYEFMPYKSMPIETILQIAHLSHTNWKLLLLGAVIYGLQTYSPKILN
jgi:hypothetical protein